MFAWITGIMAVICLAYYIVIVVYAGFAVSFGWFWPLAAAILGFYSWGSRYCRRNPKKVPLWVKTAAVTLLAAGTAVFLATCAFMFLGAGVSEKPGLDYVIVLGAKVREQGISNSLKQRLDKALEYGRKSPGTVFILSGGQGSDEPTTEAQAMYEYLLRRGIAESRLVMEPVSASTAENIAYSRLVIQRLEQNKKEMAKAGDGGTAPGRYLQVEEKPVQIGILTSSYHVFRAGMIAKKEGLDYACGIAAPSDILLFPHLCVRECAAILKDRLLGNM